MSPARRGGRFMESFADIVAMVGMSNGSPPLPA
jgi:hypothetical protein